jgi:hypothetical protein
MRIILQLLKMARTQGDGVGSSSRGGNAGAGPLSSTPSESTGHRVLLSYVFLMLISYSFSWELDNSFSIL